MQGRRYGIYCMTPNILEYTALYAHAADYIDRINTYLFVSGDYLNQMINVVDERFHESKTIRTYFI